MQCLGDHKNPVAIDRFIFLLINDKSCLSICLSETDLTCPHLLYIDTYTFWNQDVPRIEILPF